MNVANPSEIYQKLLELGWSLKKTVYKGGVYSARAVNETTGQKIERTGKSPEMALASVYRYAVQAYEVRRRAALLKVASWATDWLNEKEEIAQSYSKMPPFDEKAAPAWKALAAESKVQADAIRSQITVEVSDEPEPYQSAAAMVEDIHKNKHFIVSRANSEHPIWSQDDNVNFRIVHDVIGHGQSGGDFSWRGENLACGVHFPILSPLAREALFTECIGQTAYRSHFRGFGPQKVGFLSEFLHPVQEKEGEHIWAPHGGLPQLAMSPNGNQGGDALNQAAGMGGIFNGPGDWVNPSPTDVAMAPPSPVFTLGNPVMDGYMDKTKTGKMVSPDRPHDPNQFWTPEHTVPPVEDPSQDYIDIAATVNNAAKIDTGWAEKDEATQDKAIMQAFRVALLSPRKHIKWNAAHAQALMHTDPSTKATDLWNILEEERERHNQKLGYPEDSHLAYRKQLAFLAHELKVDAPGISDADAMKEAKTIIFRKTKEFEEQLGEDPTHDETSELQRYNMARKLVTQWLRDFYTPARGWQPGQLALASSNIESDIREVAQKHMPEGGYGDTCWNPDTKTVLWIPADWSSSEEVDAAHKALLAIPGVENVEGDAEQGLPYERNDDKFQTLRKDKNDDLIMKSPWVRIASPQLFETDTDWKPIDATGFAANDSKYGAFMGAHLDAIEEVGQHIDKIRDAAIQDIDHGGKGLHFRNTVMNMNLKGVNPKVASFAWLLLAPMTSELGVIDSHMTRGMRRSEKDVSPRGYYKLERMQRAAKDATGYSHMPLGMYHWGLWDAIRNPGSHSDHSPLRVLDPLPWDSSDAKWDAALNARSGPWVGPLAFENARGYMENAATDFDEEMAGQPAGLVPLARTPGQAAPENESAYMVPRL